jgi:hypothetical protein
MLFRHAADIARGNSPPALLIVQGDADTVLTSKPAIALHDALLAYYRRTHGDARLELVLVPRMRHGWTDDKTAATELWYQTAAWFVRYR